MNQNVVSLREHFNRILDYRFTAFDRIIEERFTAIEKAVLLAAQNESAIQRERAAELARRMDNLNNEAGRIAADKVTYLPRETHVADLKDLNNRMERIAADKITYLPRETHTSDLKDLNNRLEAIEKGFNARLAALEKVASIAIFLAVALPIAIQIGINYFGRAR